MIAPRSGHKHDGDSNDDDDDDIYDDDDDDGDDDDDDALPAHVSLTERNSRPFVEQVPHTCEDEASQAAMTICRAVIKGP